MTAPAPTQLDADGLLRQLTHLAYDRDPDGPTFCGLPGTGLADTDDDVDCPLCIAVDEAMEEAR